MSQFKIILKKVIVVQTSLQTLVTMFTTLSFVAFIISISTKTANTIEDFSFLKQFLFVYPMNIILL